MWTEIIKILAPSAITAIILGYVFNKRLEKYKSLLKVNETYITSLLEGLNKFMGDFRTIVEKSIELETQLRSNDIKRETLKEFSELSKNYNETLKGHRIYLTPLIPFGYSGRDVGIQAITALSLFCARSLREDGMRINEADKEDLLAAINDLKRGYSITSSNANKVLKWVHVGKPFNLLIK
jgi:hypothetical protein